VFQNARKMSASGYDERNDPMVNFFEKGLIDDDFFGSFSHHGELYCTIHFISEYS